MTENNVIITAIARVVLFISVASAQVHFQLKFFVGKNILLAVEEMSIVHYSLLQFIEHPILKDDYTYKGITNNYLIKFEGSSTVDKSLQRNLLYSRHTLCITM